MTSLVHWWFLFITVTRHPNLIVVTPNLITTMSKTINLRKASIIELTDELINRMPTVLSYNTVLYFFNGKYYEQLDETYTGQEIYNLFLENCPEAYSPGKAKQIIDTFKFHPRIKIAKEMNNYDNLINLNNGVLNIDTKELHPHSDSYMFSAMASVDYDPDANECPTYTAFMSTLFTDDDGNTDMHTIKNLEQLGGYLIYPQIKMDKMFIFYGNGSNGKSVLIDHVLKKFFDRRFVTSLSLNAISNEESTARDELLRSMVNFSTEQKSGDIESEELKKVISGEDISIYRKYLSVVNHKPRCKIVVAGNRFMRFKDTSDGTKRRLLIFKFMNKFEPDDSKYRKAKNMGEARVFPALPKDTIINGINNELSAILNRFLAGLDALRQNHWTFVESDNNRDTFKEYIDESDYLGSWLTNTFTTEPHIDQEGKPMKMETHSVRDILSMYRDYWEFNFPEKRFDVSTKLMGRRIKDIFRIESRIVMIRLNGRMSSTSCYDINLIKDEVWEMINNSQSSNNQTPPQPQPEQPQMTF